MAHTLQMPENVFKQIQGLAQPFVDKTPLDVIKRALDFYAQHHIQNSEQAEDRQNGANHGPSHRNVTGLGNRTPRARGVTVQVNGRRINAITVPDLYGQVLKILVDGGYAQRLKDLTPYKTSNQRYLIATSPHHPTGKHFVVPVSHRGYHMEAHKSYKTALQHLNALCEKCGLTMLYDR